MAPASAERLGGRSPRRLAARSVTPESEVPDHAHPDGVQCDRAAGGDRRPAGEGLARRHPRPSPTTSLCRTRHMRMATRIAADADGLRFHRPHRRGDYNAVLRVAPPGAAIMSGGKLPARNVDRSIRRRGGLNWRPWQSRLRGPEEGGLNMWVF